jgi:hypothetical protein
MTTADREDREPRWQPAGFRVFVRAAGIVLGCHLLPLGVAARWLSPIPHSATPTCTECGAFAPMVMMAVSAVVAASIGTGLLAATVLLAVGMRQPTRIGLLAGTTGIVLSLGVIASVVERFVAWATTT